MIDPQYLDFGEVWETKEQVIRLPVRNTTTHAIHISEFQTGCDCQPVEPKSLTIPAGETRDICLTLEKENRPERVGQLRQIRIEIRPVVNGKPAATWTIHGTIRPLIQTNMPAMMFSDSNRVGQPPVSRTLNVKFHTPGSPSVKLVPEVAAVEVRPGASAIEWKVTVSPRTDRTAGPFRAVLTIANLSDNAPVASLDLPVDGVLLEADR
ncbi:MAG: DUF1573 domain-containing protein [Planctomycetia bacterium]|nr:DUF1573 domain-containing protein [Planctomycetia bacterium]